MYMYVQAVHELCMCACTNTLHLKVYTRDIISALTVAGTHLIVGEHAHSDDALGAEHVTVHHAPLTHNLVDTLQLARAVVDVERHGRA